MLILRQSDLAESRQLRFTSLARLSACRRSPSWTDLRYNRTSIFNVHLTLRFIHYHYRLYTLYSINNQIFQYSAFTMPIIRNPFRKQDENARPVTAIERPNAPTQKLDIKQSTEYKLSGEWSHMMQTEVV